MTTASTRVELTDDVDIVESRLLLGSRDFASAVALSSVGQPIECAKFSIDGVTGLLVLASTRSRRLEALRVRVLGVGDAVSTTGTVGLVDLRGEAFLGDDLLSRFLRTVTLRISSVFHSRSGMSSTTGDTLSSCAPAVVSSSLAAGKYGSTRFVGVTSPSLRSNASPSPLSSSTVLRRSAKGVSAGLALGSEDSSSLAVRKDSAREDGYAIIGGRSRVALAVPPVRGGLGSGVGGLRAFTGVLREDFLEAREPARLSACGDGSFSSTGWPFCDKVGGVGGRPLSAPGMGPGEASGVELLSTDSESSVAVVM